MKLIGATALIGTSHAIGYVNVQNQHETTRTQELVRKINWITERRLVPELVSHDETESDEEESAYKGYYWMERPHVNFWLDFNNPTLINFRQHSNKYQSARNMLSSSRAVYGAKKSAEAYEETRRNVYENYSLHNDERFTRPTRNHLLRRMASVENMVQYKTTDVAFKKPFGSYFDYGCHCFPGSFIDPKRSPHAPPQDAIDQACQAHQWAYDCAKDDYGQDCRGKYQLYKWQGTVDDDGISTSVHCMDPKDTCAWAICEIDRHLAESLADMVRSYDSKLLVSNGFNRNEVCVHKDMTIVDRAAHNNNVHVEDEEEPAQVQTFSETRGPVSHDADSDVQQVSNANRMEFGSVEFVPVDLEELGRNSPSSPVDGDSQNQDPSAKRSPYSPGPGVEEPDWSKIDLADRALWSDKGWEIPEEEEIKSSNNGGNWDANPFTGFNFGANGPVGGKSVEPVVPATYTHATEATPETEEALDDALDEVNTTVQPMDETTASTLAPLLADDASGFDGAGNPEEGAGTSENENPIEVVMKSATTFNHKQCCGEYPKRYKYSRNKQGCCIENTGIYANKWGYLYAPSKGQCCHKSVDSMRGSKTYTRFALIEEDCNDLMADME